MKRIKSAFFKLISAFFIFIFLFKLNLCSVYAVPNENKLYARYACIIDGNSKRILYGKNESAPVPMASTTKIMTCIIALEFCDMDFKATTSHYAATMPDVQLNAVSSDVFYIKDLLYSLMLKSHNDTAVIIAENTAYYFLCNLKNNTSDSLVEYNNDIQKFDISFIPSYDYNSDFIKDISNEQSKTLVNIFTMLMNKKALLLNCNDTHFVTPNGLDSYDDEGIHHTTAYELSLIMAYCIENEDFLKITQASSHTFNELSKNKSYSVSNANAFLNMYPDIISGKTGFTADAGYCYVCAYKSGDRIFIVSLLACGWPGNKTYKWHDTRLLLDYGRSDFFPTVVSDDTKYINVPVKNGLGTSVNLYYENQYSTLLSEYDNVNIVYNTPPFINAPVKKGDKYGFVNIYINNELVSVIDLLADNSVKKITLIYHFKKLIRLSLFVDK